MSKIVNNSGIPEALFKYLSQDDYDVETKGDSLSVTEILKPVQAVVLQRRYAKEIVVDAIDRVFLLLGIGVHKVLEAEKGMVPIKRLKVKVAGRTLSGKWDRIIDNEITDYKVTSAWSIAYKSSDSDWKKQLSLYRWLFWKVKKKLLKETGFIVALLRDWAPRDVGKMNYPTKNAIQIPFQLYSMEDCERMATRRIEAITVAEKLPDDKLPECSDEERWLSAKGVYNRCGKYCEAAAFCKQWNGGQSK